MHLIKNYKILITGLYFFCYLILIGKARAQESNVIDYSDNFILRVYTLTKFNSLSIEDTKSKKGLLLQPNGTTNLGLGFNFKKAGIGITFGLPQTSESSRIYGETSRFDLQGSIYGNKIGGDGYLQYYKGYYNANPNDFVEWPHEEFPQLGDMEILSLGVTGFYFFNADRYSYRAAFVRDEMQIASAGSFMLGTFLYYDDARTENGFVPTEFPDTVLTNVDLRQFNNLAIGISAGYAYNLVIGKGLILGAAALPGFGYQRVILSNLDNSETSEDQPIAQILIKASIGYDIRTFYFSSIGSVNFRNVGYKSIDFNLATEQFRVVVGYRFGVD